MCVLRVLGPVEAGEPGRPSSPRLRRLLAALLVRRGEVASADWLAQAVWDDAQPDHAAAALQTLVSRLRAELARLDDVELVRRPPGYLLRAADQAVDAGVFEARAADGRALLGEDPARAAGLLEEALGQWRGAAYAEYAEEEFARAEAARLEELRDSCVEDRIDAGLALGRHHEAAARLDPLVRAAPLRERRRGQLVLALHRAGRTAEALAAYHAFRDLLRDELGLEPSAALRDLHTAVLRDDPALRWHAAPTARASRPRLPPPRELVGRSAERAALRELLGDGRQGSEDISFRPVTVTGPGGVGKTTLAVAVAHEVAPLHPDGAWLVELAPVPGPGAVPLAVATALDIPARAGVEPLDRVVEALSAQRALLVLDNAEHVLGAVAALVTALRRAASPVTVLVTSQAPLDVEDEQVLPLNPLDDPDATALFAARAASHRPGFRLEDDAETVTELCRRLDGLPLAIELAAARMRAMSPSELVLRMGGRLRLLQSPGREGRHRTLRAMVSWSYELLDEPGRRAFEVLSAFAGAFTLDQAERLVSGVLGTEPAEAAEQVLALVDRSLVASTPGAPTTYALLETLRAYGRERLEQRGDLDPVLRVHAEMVAGWVGGTLQDLYTARHLVAVARSAAALDEVRAAFGWALQNDLSLAARLATGPAILVEHRMSAEVPAWASSVVAHHAFDSLDADRRAQLICLAASGARFAGDLATARDLVDRASGLASDPATLAYAEFLGGEVALFERGAEAALAMLPETIARARSRGQPSLRRMLEGLRALMLGYLGQAREAATLAGRLEGEAAAAGEDVVSAWGAYVRGEVLLEADPPAAVAHLDRALERATEVGDRYLLGVTLVSAASVRGRYGTPDESVQLFRQAVEHWHHAGNWTHQWTTLRNLVVLLARLGRHREAAVVAGAAAAAEGAPPVYGAEVDRLSAVHADLLTRLGSSAYWSALAEGAAMDRDRVVEHVLDVLSAEAGR